MIPPYPIQEASVLTIAPTEGKPALCLRRSSEGDTVHMGLAMSAMRGRLSRQNSNSSRAVGNSAVLRSQPSCSGALMTALSERVRSETCSRHCEYQCRRPRNWASVRGVVLCAARISEARAARLRAFSCVRTKVHFTVSQPSPRKSPS